MHSDTLFHFYSIGSFIRQGLQPDNPKLFQAYLMLANQLTGPDSTTKWSAQAYLQMCQTLLETMCDLDIPEHWRRQCEEFFYRPLMLAEQSCLSGRLERQVSRIKRQWFQLNRVKF